MSSILFSLEKCMKCTQTKELLVGRDDIKIVTYPHDIADWNEDQLNEAKAYGVFEDLQKTAHSRINYMYSGHISFLQLLYTQ